MKTLFRWREASYWLGKALLMPIALTLLWGNIAWNLTQERQNAAKNAKTDISNLARALEENLAHSIESIDQQLLRLRALYSQDPAGFERSVTVQDGNLLPNLTLQVGIIDRAGMARFSSLGPITAPIDLSDRDHFRAHLTDSADFLFVSKPVLGRVSNTVTVQFARKILDADGRFAGVIVISLDPHWLSRFHASLDIGPSSVLVVGQDAVVRASSPIAEYVGKDLSGARLFDAAKRSKQGVFLGQALPEGPESFISYRTLSEFPLIVAVSLEADAVFAAYRKSVRWQVGIGMALSLIVLAIGAVLIRHRAAQRRSEALVTARAMETVQTATILRGLIEATPLAVIGLVGDKRVCIWNRSAEGIFGYNADEVLGQPYPLVPPQAHAEHEELRVRNLSGESLRDIEMQRRCKDGRLVDLRFWGSINYVTPDNEDAVLFMLEDITERKRAAAQLQESTARLRGFLASSPDAIIVIDEAGDIIVASDRTEDLFGYKPEEIIGKTLDLLLPERIRAAHAGHLRGYLRTPQTREMGTGLELHARRKDGSEFPTEIGLSPYRCAMGLFVIAAVRDITRRRQAQEALRLSEARFRSAFDAAGHGMAWMGLDGRILKVNATYCRIMGYSEAELLARTTQDITLPEDLARDVANRARFIAGAIFTSEREKRYVRQDGAIVWAQVNSALVRDAAGAPLHYTVQLQDITERKRTEERLRQAQKMEAVGQLTAGIAHDFNNILAAVIGNLDMISEQIATDPTAAGRLTDEAIEAALSGAELVKRLLAFARQQPLQTKPMDLTEIIANMVPLLRPSLGERIKIRTSAAADLWPALVDAAQVESALLNLAINARDAMPDGGVLSLDASNTHVNGPPFQADDDLKTGDYVIIAVTDSGTGMAPEVVAHVFEPFFTTKGVGAGSGLGLSMVLGTMQQLGGSARIYSEPGHGTTVRLFLPRAAAVTDTPTPAIQATVPVHPTGTERILLVEDNDLIRRELEVTLKSLGYTVVVAPSADAALALWEQDNRFDLVFSDIIMPGQLDGIGLARVLQARDPHIKILLSSGFANPAAILGDIAEQGLEVVQKPYRKAALAARLRAILDQ